MASVPKLSIIIVSYNTTELLRNCLLSLPIQDSDYEIIIVDNNSSDGTIAMLSKDFSSINLIKNSHNKGFASANNQAIKVAKSDLILLLNSDTLATKEALIELISFAKSHPKAGIISPVLLNSDGSIQPNGGAVPRLSNVAAWMFFFDDLPLVKKFYRAYHQDYLPFYMHSRQTGWVSGAAMLIKKSVIQDVGLLDDQIFMYAEDVDFCMRARKNGWQVWTHASAQITHLSHRSSSKTNALLGEIKGLKYVFTKHKPAWEPPLVNLILKTGSYLRSIIFGKIIGNQKLYEAYRKAYQLG